MAVSLHAKLKDQIIGIFFLIILKKFVDLLIFKEKNIFFRNKKIFEKNQLIRLSILSFYTLKKFFFSFYLFIAILLLFVDIIRIKFQFKKLSPTVPLLFIC